METGFLCVVLMALILGLTHEFGYGGKPKQTPKLNQKRFKSKLGCWSCGKMTQCGKPFIRSTNVGENLVNRRNNGKELCCACYRLLRRRRDDTINKDTSTTVILPTISLSFYIHFFANTCYFCMLFNNTRHVFTTNTIIQIRFTLLTRFLLASKVEFTVSSKRPKI